MEYFRIIDFQSSLDLMVIHAVASARGRLRQEVCLRVGLEDQPVQHGIHQSVVNQRILKILLAMV